jgi:hypothetical protein
LDEIHRTAQEYPGTPMQEMADVTWADSQVFLASRAYLTNRQAATDMLSKAQSAYQGVIQTSPDEALTGRAKLGLARVYEMQNQLDKAKEQYRQVTGPFADYARQQAERLSKPEAADTYAWLATAQPPATSAPTGPGTPGKQPEFSAGEIALPGAADTDAGQAPDTQGASEAFENLLKSLREEQKNETPAQPEQQKNASEGSPAAPPAEKAAAPNETKDSPPRADADKNEDKPVDKPADAPAKDKSAQ